MWINFAALSEHGFGRAVLVDDYGYEEGLPAGVRTYHEGTGVQIIARDVTSGIDDIPGEFDVVTSFDSMEHWHHSPKRLFHQVAEKLRPGGVFILGVPNCANMKKRLTMLVGRARWSTMLQWYEPPVFRGHVREPSCTDLKYIARDMGLRIERILGRNWLGHRSPQRIIRWATYVTDYALRLRPGLCDDIYLVARKAL